MRILPRPTNRRVRKMMTQIGFLFSIILMLTSCYTTTFYLDTDRLRVAHDGEASHASTVLSTVDLDDPTQLRPLCPSGISKLEMEQTLTDGLLHYFTLGFYSTQTTRVWCKRRHQ
ncbi:MAG: hypothetical protein HQM13_09555 [SAR324 cluster bacterium]|nr:hypothetical protein [SAR324 cluster bacterium]